jgi:Cellulase (glycosyl hydrolase family 5)
MAVVPGTRNTAAILRPAAAISGTGRFTASGDQILDPYGKPWRALGVNLYDKDAIHGGAVTASACWPTRLFPRVNFIRLGCFDLRADTVAVLAPIVNGVTNNGQGPCVIELEHHVVAGATSKGHALAAVCAWYETMAAAFKANPFVIFGTENEPACPNGVSDPSNAPMIAAICKAVRSAGNGNLMLICAPGGYSVTALDQSAFSGVANVAWDLHYYSWLGGRSSLLTDHVNALAKQVAAAQKLLHAPCVIGEYGEAAYVTDRTTPNDPGASQVLIAVQSRPEGSAIWEFAQSGIHRDALVRWSGGPLFTPIGVTLLPYGEGFKAYTESGTPNGTTNP